MSKQIIAFLTGVLLLFSLFGCTLGGVELSLIGKWNITEYEIDGYSNEIVDVEGHYEIKSDDTYIASVRIGSLFYTVEGTVTADSIASTITFSSENGDEVEYTYTLAGDELTLSTDAGKIMLTREW